MGGCAEGRLGHADHRNAELSVRMRTQPRPASRVKIGIAVNHQQLQPADTVQHRTQRRQLPHEELTWPVRQHLGHDRSALGQHIHERGIAGHHGRRPGAPRAQVMHIHSRAHLTAWTAAGFHAYEDALRDRKTDEAPGSARMLPGPPGILRASRRHTGGEQADCHDVTYCYLSAVINGADIAVRRASRGRLAGRRGRARTNILSRR